MNSDPKLAQPYQLLRVPQVAERLTTSARQVWRLLATGALPAVRVGARGTRIKASDLDKYVASLRSAR